MQLADLSAQQVSDDQFVQAIEHISAASLEKQESSDFRPRLTLEEMSQTLRTLFREVEVLHDVDDREELGLEKEMVEILTERANAEETLGPDKNDLEERISEEREKRKTAWWRSSIASISRRGFLKNSIHHN